MTFIELIKNPRYEFWRKSFTRSAPEVVRVFDSIARSCIGPSAATFIQQQLDGAATAAPGGEIAAAAAAQTA